MKKIALSALALLTTATWLSVAQASDEQKFDRMIGRYAVSASDIFDKPFSPKAPCVSSDKSAGFLMLATDGRLFCAVPSFSSEGKLDGYDVTFDFATIAK